MKREKRGKGRHSRPGTPHQRPDGRWEQWITVDGTRYKRSGDSKQAVRDKITALRAELASPERQAARDQGPTFAELCEKALQKYDADGSTYRTYGYALDHWRRLIGNDTRQAVITASAVQAAIDALTPTKSSSTLTTYYAALRVVLGADHPALRGVTLPPDDDDDEAPSVVVPSDLTERLQIAAQYHPMGIAIGLGFGAGIRAGEAAALRWQDVNVVQNLLSINGSIKPGPGGWVRGRTKNRKARLVRVSVDLMDWLERHRRIQADTAALAGYPAPEFVIANPDTGQRVGRDVPVKVLRELLASVCTEEELAMFGNLRYHALRHTHISMMLSQGAGPADVAARVGHSMATLWEHYAHAVPNADTYLAELAGALFPISRSEANRQATPLRYTASQRPSPLISA